MKRGYFGPFGGQFVPEMLRPALQQLEAAFEECRRDEGFWQRFRQELSQYAGRPTPLYFAERLTRHYGRARIYLKREDLNHTGAHKINNALGQILLARRMGKKRIIAETGAGQHGVATATVAARAGMTCVIYMGAADMARQHPNVQRMRMLGAEVRAVHSGTRTLKDATNEAIRDWLTHVEDTHYIIGSAVGPHPFPTLVREFQKVIGQEVLQQCQEQGIALPDWLVACVGGGSNAIGLFYPFLPYPAVRMVGVEAAGKGVSTGKHAATLTAGRPGVFHGMLSFLLQNRDGQVQLPHSISAGLDYPGVGPEHSYLRETGRVAYVSVTDEQALQAGFLLARTEGIIPALESAHALAYLEELLPATRPNQVVVVNLSGRGDKDMATYIQAMSNSRERGEKIS